MTRTLSIAAIALVGLSAPVLAAEKNAANANDAHSIGTHSAELSVAANSNEVRKLLKAQGYTNVSPLARDRNGHWTGVAMKDGERKFLAVALPKATPVVTN